MKETISDARFAPSRSNEACAVWSCGRVADCVSHTSKSGESSGALPADISAGISADHLVTRREQKSRGALIGQQYRELVAHAAQVVRVAVEAVHEDVQVNPVR